MMVVPPPSATIVSCVSPPEADRGEKTAVKPIPVIKTSRATRYLLGNVTSPGIFCPFQKSFAGVNSDKRNLSASGASLLARRDSHLGPPFRAKGWSASEKDA